MYDSNCPHCFMVCPGGLYPQGVKPKERLDFNLLEELQKKEQQKLNYIQKILPKGYKIVKE